MSQTEDKQRALETARLLDENLETLHDLYRNMFYYPTTGKTDRNTVERIRKYCFILKELNNLGPLVDCVYLYTKEKKSQVKELNY